MELGQRKTGKKKVYFMILRLCHTGWRPMHWMGKLLYNEPLPPSFSYFKNGFNCLFFLKLCSAFQYDSNNNDNNNNYYYYHDLLLQ